MVTFISALIIFLLSLTAGVSDAYERRFDVAVVGAGTGGSMAAIQAARQGMKVALIEESDWVGGQMTGAAVSTMDDVRLTRTGIYKEFISRIRDYYTVRGASIGICYWGSDTISLEPKVGQQILKDMMTETGNVTLFLNARAVSVSMNKNKLEAVTFDQVKDGKKESVTITAKVFIDATETGDLIPMTGARYRSGNSISPKINPNGVIQDITYVAVVRRYPDGVPDELVIKTPPPGYEVVLPYFRERISVSGDWWPGSYPFNVPTHNAYRAMPDIANPQKARIDGNDRTTWPLISRTAVNWANDFPGRRSGKPGMEARFLEDKEYRRDMERQAMAVTLCFIYYMQNELGMYDWSVDNSQGYGSYFSNDWQNWQQMPKEFAPILSHFPPFPYVRESRRIVGLKTMTAKDVKYDPVLRRVLSSNHESIALGEYPTDIHGMSNKDFLDKDLDEHPEDIPADTAWKGRLSQIPIGALIPEKVDGLLAAEKNISVSRVVNGSTRLQPVTMLTGQAAGAIAAEAVKNGVEPRDVNTYAVQWDLLSAGDKLSQMRFEDVPPESPWWKGVEIVALYEFIAPSGEGIFGVDSQMCWVDVRDAFRRTFDTKDMPKREYLELVTGDGFNKWLNEYFGEDAKNYKKVIDIFSGDGILTKGQLASAIAELKYINERSPKPVEKAPKSKKAKKKRAEKQTLQQGEDPSTVR